jgi:thiamine-phosphate pyrophosphorylase
MAKPDPEGCRLYVITPPAIDLPTFPDLLAATLDAGDVAVVQLRLKHLLRPVAQSRGVAFLMNDRPDLAVAHGCDGAHVGQEDTPAPVARTLLGGLTLGVSCHGSRDLAFTAGEDGADYVAFGAFFPTASKEDAPVEASPDILRWWSDLAVLPSVAIGGITAANCAPLVQAGADFLAVIGAIWGHPEGPAAGVRAMNAAIAAAGQDVTSPPRP